MKPRLLILYETSVHGLPHGSAHLRLLRPLSHPAAVERFHVAASPFYAGQDAELVVVDRFWRPDLSLEHAVDLVEAVRRRGGRLIYHLDDDLLRFVPPPGDTFAAGRPAAVEYFLCHADALLVSTPALAQRFAEINHSIHVIGNALDERLLPGEGMNLHPDPFGDRPLTLGYMGTRTHDADLRSILPALERFGREFAPGGHPPLRLQIVGGVANEETWDQLRALPFPVQRIDPPAAEYPDFLLWFASSVRWDVALAPLVDDEFNQAKSDVKYLDYAAAGAPGIYSKGTVYAGVEHGVTGWLAENDPAAWTGALHTLAGDASLRAELAARAQRHLYGERILRHRVYDWIAALESVWHG